MLLAGIGGSSGGPGMDDYLPVIFRALVAMVFIGLLIGGLVILRKRLTEGEADDATSSFSMGGMRDLVRQGKMTQEEFDHAKAAIVEATQKQIARDAARKADAERKAGQINPRRRAVKADAVDPAADDDVPPSHAN